jgi:hypothetical protein
MHEVMNVKSLLYVFLCLVMGTMRHGRKYFAVAMMCYASNCKINFTQSVYCVVNTLKIIYSETRLQLVEGSDLRN